MNKALLVKEKVKILIPLLVGHGIRVTQRGMRAYVEYDQNGIPVRVNIPFIPDNATDEFLAAVEGFLDHEVSHVLHTDPKVLREAEKLGVKSLYNLIEDVYIERKMTEVFKGSLSNLTNMHKVFVREYTDKKLQEDPQNAMGYLLVAGVRALAGQSVFEDYMRDKWVLLGPVPAIIGDYCKKTLPTIRDSQHALEVAFEIHRMLGQPKDNEEKHQDKKGGEGETPEEEGESGQSTNPQDEPSDDDQKESKGESPDAGDDEIDQREKEESNDEGDDQQEGEEPFDDESSDSEGGDDREGEESDADDSGDDSGESDDAAGQDSGSTGEDETSDDSGDAKGESTSGESGGEQDDGSDDETDEGDETDEEDETEEDGEGEEPAEAEPDMQERTPAEQGDAAPLAEFDPSKLMEDIPDFDDAVAEVLSAEAIELNAEAEYVIYTTDFDVIEPCRSRANDAAVEKMVNTVEHMVGPIQKDLERAIAAQSRSVWSTGHRSGRLNPTALARLTTFNDERAFRRRHVHRTKDTAISLVVDCSGSMYGSKIQNACYATYALASVLERIRVPYEILGFTTKGPIAIPKSERRDAMMRGIVYARDESLYIPIFKDFNERLDSEVRSRLAALQQAMWLRENVDGESLAIAASRLMRRQEERKIMIVLSDGLPACGGISPELMADLKRTVQKIEKANVTVLGIGIQSEAPKMFYSRYVLLNKVNELAGEVIRQIRDLLLK
jgi:cobaltochelatase CobT